MLTSTARGQICTLILSTLTKNLTPRAQKRNELLRIVTLISRLHSAKNGSLEHI